MNGQQNINNDAEQPAQTDTTHTPQTEALDNLQLKQTEQDDEMNNRAEQNPIQPTQIFPGLLNLTRQASLSEIGSLNEQQQYLSLSLSPSSSIIQIKQHQQPDQKQFLFVTDPNDQFIQGYSNPNKSQSIRLLIVYHYSQKILKNKLKLKYLLENRFNTSIKLS